MKLGENHGLTIDMLKYASQPAHRPMQLTVITVVNLLVFLIKLTWVAFCFLSRIIMVATA